MDLAVGYPMYWARHSLYMNYRHLHGTIYLKIIWGGWARLLSHWWLQASGLDSNHGFPGLHKHVRFWEASHNHFAPGSFQSCAAISHA